MSLQEQRPSLGNQAYQHTETTFRETRRPRVWILGTGIDPVTMDEAIAAFSYFIRRGVSSLVYNVNVDICMKAARDARLRVILESADLVLVDGTPMTWAARFLGTPLPERVSGSDFLPLFCAEAARQGYRLFFLGGAPGVADRAMKTLRASLPTLRVVGTYSPPLGFEHDREETRRTIRIVRDARPDVLFAAFGAPKEQMWLTEARWDLAVPVAMGVGSSFDYLAGRLSRAPVWMQKAGLEWTYRLAQEPRRLWRRYLIDDPPFVYHIIKDRLLGRK